MSGPYEGWNSKRVSMQIVQSASDTVCGWCGIKQKKLVRLQCSATTRRISTFRCIKIRFIAFSVLVQ